MARPHRRRRGLSIFFLFGLTAAEVVAAKAAGYRPRAIYETNLELREAIDLIGAGEFSNGDRDLFRPLVESLLDRDEYVLLADYYQAYLDCQQRWAKRTTTSRTGRGCRSSLRAGRPLLVRPLDREYCRDI